jgi:hypothetical protein
MHRLHLKHNLRTAGFLLVFAGLASAAGMLAWANHTGMPEPWRRAIEAEVSKHGAHVQIGWLSYLPWKGLVANDVRVFSDAARQKELSKVETVTLDFDKTKFARGLLRLNKIELSDATLRLPVDPDQPDAETLEITGVNGRVLVRSGRLLEIKDARGTIAGIEFTLRARLLGYRGADDAEDDPGVGRRRKLIAQAVRELENWHFGTARPPTARLFVEGDLSDRSTFKARLALEAPRVEKGGHALAGLSAEAVLDGEVLTFTSVRATDSIGEFDGRFEYDTGSRHARFDARSSLDLPRLLDAWLAMEIPSWIEIAGAQSAEVEGELSLPADASPSVRMSGKAACKAATVKGVPFRSLATTFAAADGNYYLRDIHADHADGSAHGKLLIEDNVVRLMLSSTLPPAVYEPFFPDHPLERVLADFGLGQDGEVDLTLEGQFDTRDRRAWAFAGRGTASQLAYRGVPTRHASCGFSLSHHELDFFDGEIEFNYDDYPMRNAFNGPGSGNLTVKRVRYDAADKSVSIDSLEGIAWAAPIVRMFAIPVADTLERYRFHQPPSLKASGQIDVTPAGRTALDVSFSSNARAGTDFLGKSIALSSPSGKVTVRGSKVTVDNLKVTAFNGAVAGRFVHQDGRLSGDMNWTRLSLPALGSAYGFPVESGGAVTGRIDFSLNGSKISGLTAKGLVGVDQAELFSVPVFGPLTPLISGVLNDPKAGSESANSAFLTFAIQNGMLSTNDFHTSTSSLVFTGDGTVDLNTQALDMNLRMNARGFLGLITLPLRSMGGLFQFHGTGPLKQPNWEKVRFTAPPADQEKALLEAPRARIVGP